MFSKCSKTLKKHVLGSEKIFFFRRKIVSLRNHKTGSTLGRIRIVHIIYLKVVLELVVRGSAKLNCSSMENPDRRFCLAWYSCKRAQVPHSSGRPPLLVHGSSNFRSVVESQWLFGPPATRRRDFCASAHGNRPCYWRTASTQCAIDTVQVFRW